MRRDSTSPRSSGDPIGLINEMSYLTFFTNFGGGCTTNIPLASLIVWFSVVVNSLDQMFIES